MSVQSQIDRLNTIKQRIRTNLVAQGITVPEDTMLEAMAEQILSVAGEDGQRGTGLLSVTTAPSSYTTAVGGITPKYRMAISTIKTQAGVTEVLLGDTIRYSYYQYPIAYLDASYAYATTRVSIRGATGATGATGAVGADGEDGYTPVKGVDYYTPAEKEELIDSVVEQTKIVKVAEPPEFVNSLADCADTSKMYVLPNAHLAAYMTSEVTTEGSTVPNFTNLYDTSKGAYIKDGQRYSKSNAAFKAQASDCAVVVPLGLSYGTTNVTLRIQGATRTGASYYDNVYFNSTNDFSTTTNVFGGTWSGMPTPATVTESNGQITIVFKPNQSTWHYDWLVFHVAAGVDPEKLIVTLDEEITYTTTTGGTEIVTEWVDTGIEYNQPPDYADRVVAVEKKTAQLVTDVNVLKNKVNNIGGGAVSGPGGMDVFAFAAYPPSPQLPGDGSDEADFNTANVTTPEVYAYMDALWSRYRTYMVKQNLGKDSSGQHDYYRYVFSKAYWRAWYKENYPKMFAWQNGSTVVYSVSVSPRVGDTMYTTPYIGTAYNTVSAVNSETIGVASTRTVNGLVFTRYTDGDVEPTIVYTVPIAITSTYKGRTYTDAFNASHGIAEFTHEYIVDSQGTKFFRYPFEDKKLDKSSLFSVFILTNEHGNHGDSMIPSVVVMRMLKDMCNNADVPFLRWLKENAVVTVIPVGNPYGGYNNANGVNINRNYDTPGWAGSNTDPAGGTKEEGAFGAYAGSEIETQYIMNTIQQAKANVGLSGHGRGVPTDVLGEYNSSAMYQGCGFDVERMWKVEEALFSMYNFGFQPNGQHTTADQTADDAMTAGKSPSYIQYAGAVGGLIEIDDYEVGTLDSFTPLAMEQAYAEVLLVLQNWCEEALNK